MNDEQHGNPSTARLLAALRRRILVILVPILVVPAVVYAVSAAEEKQYQASATLLFRDPQFDQRLFGTSFLQQYRDPERTANTNAQLVSLGVVGDRAAQRLNVREGSDVSASIAVEPNTGSDLVTITATSTEPRFAARMANVFAEEYIDFRKEADRGKLREAQGLVEDEIASLTRANGSPTRIAALQQRAEELEVLASLQTGNAELVQPARVPAVASSPKPLRNAMPGLLLGIVVGLLLALLFERLDRKIRDMKEAEEIFDRPLLASIPQSRSLGRTESQTASGAEAEAFRMLRVNLQYFNVDRGIRSVLVTSPAPGDGKSTVAWNLASVSAASGAKVLLMEADLRQPALMHGFETGNGAMVGLSGALARGLPLSEIVMQAHPRIAGAEGTTFDVAPAGLTPPNPAELVESDRMRALLAEAEANYDLVVIDTPPTSVVSDAVPLTTRVSGVIVVCRLGRTRRDAASRLKTQLDHLGARTLGVVANGVSTTSLSYGQGYYYGYAAAAERRETVDV